MTYREIILSAPAFKPEQYAAVSGNSTFGACAAYYLKEHGVPLTMNYIGITMFRMFPDKFYCDEDFKEYPSLDILNREICMHMTITKKKTDAILAGSAKRGFQLTKYGELLGKQTYEGIAEGKFAVAGHEQKKIDLHKEGTCKEYTLITNSKYYLEFLKMGMISRNAVWNLFDVIPYTQVTTIQKKIKLAQVKAKEINDTNALAFMEKLVAQLD